MKQDLSEKPGLFYFVVDFKNVFMVSLYMVDEPPRTGDIVGLHKKLLENGWRDEYCGDDWLVAGKRVGNQESTTSVVGSESECRTIAKLMVSSGTWSDACLYPPAVFGEYDDAVRSPYEVYTAPTLGGTRGTEHSMNWMGWEHQKFDE